MGCSVLSQQTESWDANPAPLSTAKQFPASHSCEDQLRVEPVMPTAPPLPSNSPHPGVAWRSGLDQKAQSGALKPGFEPNSGALRLRPAKSGYSGKPLATKVLHHRNPKPKTMGVTHYGYRFYDPVTGRWPSRDPIAEVGSHSWQIAQSNFEEIEKAIKAQYISNSSYDEGWVYYSLLKSSEKARRRVSEQIAGINLYGMVSNNPIDKVDVLGLADFSEKWDALWDAGLIDANEASNIAEKAAKDARQKSIDEGWYQRENAHDGRHNGKEDAYRHCLWNCRMVKEINQEDAKQIADNHEKHGKNPKDEEKMDKCNNRAGRSCAKEKNCADCCSRKLADGTLDVLPNSRW